MDTIVEALNYESLCVITQTHFKQFIGSHAKLKKNSALHCVSWKYINGNRQFYSLFHEYVNFFKSFFLQIYPLKPSKVFIIDVLKNKLKIILTISISLF